MEFVEINVQQLIIPIVLRFNGMLLTVLLWIFTKKFQKKNKTENLEKQKTEFEKKNVW